MQEIWQEAISAIDKLAREHSLSNQEFLRLLQIFQTAQNSDLQLAEEISQYLFEKSRGVAQKNFGNKIYTRGLIEFTNYCKNDCFYCGIRRSNQKASRYRLTKEEILECCKTGYALGFRTFVLQGGEDGYFTDAKLVEIVAAIREEYRDCAITLSLGERSAMSYKKLFAAGANRYLLRHETADAVHYGKLHPKELTLATRMSCLKSLQEIGFQVGVGFMVGSPYQTLENLVGDLQFIKSFKPEMVGIGPFIPNADTVFAKYSGGSLELTLFLLALIRLMQPNVLLPATTALGTINADGREKGVLAGANVVMPNLSPVAHRKDYALYDNKISTGEEAAEGRELLAKRMAKIGYELAVDRGDYK